MDNRKTVNEIVYESIYNIFPSTLENLHSHVETLIETYGKEATIDLNYGYEGEVYDFHINYERPETDEEMTKRIKRAKKARETRRVTKLKKEEKERKELARLLEKYGEKN